MEFYKLYNELRSRKKHEIEDAFYLLLRESKIDFVDLAKQYVKFLEEEKCVSRRRESIFSSLLCMSVDGVSEDNKKFFDSRAFVMLEPWIPKKEVERMFPNRTNQHMKYVKGEIDDAREMAKQPKTWVN